MYYIFNPFFNIGFVFHWNDVFRKAAYYVRAFMILIFTYKSSFELHHTGSAIAYLALSIALRVIPLIDIFVGN